MPPQKLIRKWKISKEITTHVKRKSLLHEKIVSNNNFIIVKLLSIYVLTEERPGNSN